MGVMSTLFTITIVLSKTIVFNRFVSDSWSPKTRLLGSFCGGQDEAVVEAHSGVLSVFYSDDSGLGFNASFSVLDCPYHCTDPNRRCNEDGECVCKEGLSEPR